MTTNHTKSEPEELRDKITEIVATIPLSTGAKLTEIGWEKYGENESEAIEKLLALISTETNRARLDEWQIIADAEITHGGSQAPFNPYGMPISTPATKELTTILRSYANERIAQLQKNGGSGVEN